MSIAQTRELKLYAEDLDDQTITVTEDPDVVIATVGELMRGTVSEMWDELNLAVDETADYAHDPLSALQEWLQSTRLVRQESGENS